MPRGIQLGLAANWRQFALLVLVNGLVGAMVGLERAVLPLVAADEFGVASRAAILAFVATFGLSKGLSNLVAGHLMDARGRRRTLLIGWIIGIPVPIAVLVAPSWWWIVAANALLGVNQGLTWSTTVVMKIDLVGRRRRGLAMGFNEAAGYISLAGAALVSGYVAANLGLRTGPALLGIVISLSGLLVSWLFIADTSEYVRLEEAVHASDREHVRLGRLLRASLWSDRGLFSVSQAGFFNNLNDSLAWGLFPFLFAASGMTVRQIGAISAIYPAAWGIGQLATGALSDRWSRRWMIVDGMVVQGIALVSMALTRTMITWCAALVALGVGTALVYPTLLAAVGDIARPSARGAFVGVYRLWRDFGYVAGAAFGGFMADYFGMSAAIAGAGVATAASGIAYWIRSR